MESTNKRTRTDHTTLEYRNLMKAKKEEVRVKLTLKLNRLDREIAELEKPYVPKERKLPVRKASVAGVIKSAKDDFSPEELREILATAKRKKMEMGAE